MATSRQDQGPLYATIQQLLEWPMMGLAALFLASAVLQELPQLPAPYQAAARLADSFIWAAFVAEYLTLLVLARRRAEYIRTHLIDLVIVLLPLLRLLRLLRFVRGLRAAPVAAIAARQWRDLAHIGYRHGLTYVLLGVVTVMGCGAYVVYLAERGTNEAFSTYGASLWWALETATTVGYGDMAPQTTAGRSIAAVFMIVSIAIYGVVAGLLATVFIRHEQQDMALLARRIDEAHEVLARLEAKIERLAPESHVEED